MVTAKVAEQISTVEAQPGTPVAANGQSGGVKATEQSARDHVWIHMLPWAEFESDHLRIFDGGDQIPELNGFALTEIKNIEKRPAVIERGHCALNHVVDVSVIAARRAVTELLDRLPGVNAPGESMDRQIWPLARTVNSKISQRDHTHLVKMRVCRAKKFAGDFRRGIWTERLSKMLIFRKGNCFRDPVNG